MQSVYQYNIATKAHWIYITNVFEIVIITKLILMICILLFAILNATAPIIELGLAGKAWPFKLYPSPVWVHLNKIIKSIQPKKHSMKTIIGTHSKEKSSMLLT